jgi:lipid II:glycine glycyltransferase (peptidoglycan interpeptide bridge formation enzyme)
MENEFYKYKLENEVITGSNQVHFDFQKVFPESSILQLPSFAEKFYAKRNCRFFRLLNNENVVGICLVSEYFFHAEIQFGPQVITDSEMGIFVEKICGFYRKRLYGQIKICLPTGLQKGTFESVFDHLSGIYSMRKDVKGNWSSLLLNLTEEREKIQSGYSENLKRNIKKAVQQGLHVRQIDHEKDILRLGVIFDKLYERRKLKSQWKDSPNTFLAWYRSAELSCKAMWFGVYNPKFELLGGIMLVNQKDMLFYQLGASDPEKRDLSIMHLCFHQAIIFAKENNFSFFDFGGYDTDAKENDQTYNINAFKKQFGGELVSSFPNLLIVLNRPMKILTDILINIRNRMFK